ncbi:MAG TPA: LysR family transcriptional regulator [Stenomitos sp.]
MNLNEMRTFTEILRRGSLTEAGRALGLTQSGVTRQLQRLEQDLGATLLRRDTAPVTATVAGERFGVFANQFLREFDAMRQELAIEAQHPALAIAASTTPGEFLVPNLLADVIKSYPGWRISVAITDSAEVIDQVERGAVSLGFVGSIMDRPALRFVPFVPDELVVAVRADHPLAQRTAIALEELGRYPFVLREEGSGTLSSLQHLLSDQGRALPRLQVVATLGSTQAVLSSILAGAGIGIVSSRSLAPYGPDRLKAIRLVGLPLWRQLYLVHRQSELRTQAVARFTKAAMSWAAYQ